MAELARNAIESEQKFQRQLILEDKDFVVDWVSFNLRRFFKTQSLTLLHYYISL